MITTYTEPAEYHQECHCPECQKKLEGVAGLLEGQRMAIEPAVLERKERSKKRR